MNCDCIGLIERETDKFKRLLDIRWVILVEQLSRINFETRKTRMVTYSTVEIMEEGRKRSRKVKLVHNYCPFCGVRQDDVSPARA